MVCARAQSVRMCSLYWIVLYHLPEKCVDNSNVLLYYKRMNCPTCKADAQRFGTNRNGSQRFRCVERKKTFSTSPADRVAGSTIPLAQVEKVLQLLLEGCS